MYCVEHSLGITAPYNSHVLKHSSTKTLLFFVTINTILTKLISPNIHLRNSVLISDATDSQFALGLQKQVRVLATGCDFQ